METFRRMQSSSMFRIDNLVPQDSLMDAFVSTPGAVDTQIRPGPPRGPDE